MRFLMLLLLVAVALAEHKLSRPHVPHYSSTKAAFAELARSLDTLAYVLTAKGVKPYALCGLSVPELGGYQGSLFSNYAPRTTTAAPTAAPTTTQAYVAPRATSAPKIAVVRYPNKKALEAALEVAAAEIIADNYQVQAKVAQVQVDELKVKADDAAGNAAAAAADAARLAADRAAAAKLELEAREERDAAERLKTEKVGATEFVDAPTTAAVRGTERQTDAPTAAPTTAAPTEPAPRTGNTPAGRALVDGQGRTLYTFEDEADGKVRCLGECASFWPFVPAGSISGEGIGSVRASNGNHATYKGRPLYRFVSDAKPGQSNGHNENGFTICRP